MLLTGLFIHLFIENLIIVPIGVWCVNELIRQWLDISESYKLKIRLWNNNKKSFLAPLQNLWMYYDKKQSITLMILLMNRLTFYSRK